MSRLAARLLAALTIWIALAGGAAASGTPEVAAHQEVLVLFRLPPAHMRAGADYTGSYADAQGSSSRKRLAARVARRQGMTLVEDWAMPLIGYDCYVMRAPPGLSAADAAARLSAEPGVAWAEPMNFYRARGVAHNDPLYPVQPAATAWRLGDLHEIATGRKVRVAVIDSMVDLSQPDLAGQVQLSENLAPQRGGAPERHGTAVAGVIAARADNGLGIAGVAPGARLLALRACWQPAPSSDATVCDSLSLAKALVAAVDRRAQVVNLSLSGPPAPLLGKLIDAALARGVSVVGAYDAALPGGGFPASHPGVIAVSDTSAPAGVYLAPGRDVPSTQPGGRWGLVNGSSYAAAHVSGLIALMRERSARAPNAIAVVRGGFVDACAALLQTSGSCDCACARLSQNPAPARR